MIHSPTKPMPLLENDPELRARLWKLVEEEIRYDRSFSPSPTMPLSRRGPFLISFSRVVYSTFSAVWSRIKMACVVSHQDGVASRWHSSLKPSQESLYRETRIR